MKSSVPEPVLLRIPMYIQALKRLLSQADGEPGSLSPRSPRMVSTTWFESELQLNASQVRKDLAYCGLTGRPRTGFVAEDLLLALERLVGWNKTRYAYLAGAGHLGAALLAHERIVSHGVKVLAAFDVDKRKIGRDFVGVPTYDIAELPARTRESGVEIGIIAVPQEHAQEVADLMIDGGVRGIWNFAPNRLLVPEGILVQNEDIFSSVVMLSQRLEHSL